MDLEIYQKQNKNGRYYKPEVGDPFLWKNIVETYQANLTTSKKTIATLHSCSQSLVNKVISRFKSGEKAEPRVHGSYKNCSHDFQHVVSIVQTYLDERKKVKHIPDCQKRTLVYTLTIVQCTRMYTSLDCLLRKESKWIYASLCMRTQCTTLIFCISKPQLHWKEHCK